MRFSKKCINIDEKCDQHILTEGEDIIAQMCVVMLHNFSWPVVSFRCVIKKKENKKRFSNSLPYKTTRSTISVKHVSRGQIIFKTFTLKVGGSVAILVQVGLFQRVCG